MTPAHYIVVENKGDLDPDFIQNFTYATSFMYFNWAGTIRIPAPVQVRCIVFTYFCNF